MNTMHYFSVNDIVMLKPNISYLNIYRNEYYKIIDTYFNQVSKSYLVKIEPINKKLYHSLNNFYKATNFMLVNQPIITDKQETKSTKIKNFIVMDSFFVLAKFDTREEAENFIEEKINKNPTQEYHIFIRAATGSFPKLPVKWDIVNYD